jgi:hypothetical protein
LRIAFDITPVRWAKEGNMANEQSYRIVLMHDPNAVTEAFACPGCHENDTDSLQINPDDTVVLLVARSTA